MLQTTYIFNFSICKILIKIFQIARSLKCSFLTSAQLTPYKVFSITALAEIGYFTNPLAV